MGEFKGWFSNLFNWKTGSSPPSPVFYSSDDLSKTRDTTLRLLQALTFGISRVILNLDAVGSPHAGREIYHCRLDQAVVDAQHPGITLKPLKLRLEFSSAAPASPAPVPVSAPMSANPDLSGRPLSTAYGPGPGPGATQMQGLASPNYLATPQLRTSSAGRASASFGLGRTASQTGSSAGPGAPPTPLMQAHWELPVDCNSVVVMTFEKGSTSTFRVLRQRVQELLGGAGVVPPPTPSGAMSPMVGSSAAFGEGYQYQRIGV